MKKQYFLVRELDSEQTNIGIIGARNDSELLAALNTACGGYFDADCNISNCPKLDDIAISYPLDFTVYVGSDDQDAYTTILEISKTWIY